MKKSGLPRRPAWCRRPGRHAIISLLFITLLFICACNDNQAGKADPGPRTLVGKWDPVHAEGKDLTDQDKEEILRRGYMEFDKHGQFTMHSREDGRSRSGLFNYDEKTNSLKLVSGDEEKNYTIEWMDNNKLVMIIPEENLRVSFNKRKGLMPILDDKEDKRPPGDRRDAGIVGMWKPVDVVADDISEEERLKILNEMTVEFTVGGNYISTRPEKNEYGKYTFEQGKLRLETEGKTHVLTVEGPTNDRIILRDENGTVTLQRKY